MNNNLNYNNQNSMKDDRSYLNPNFNSNKEGNKKNIIISIVLILVIVSLGIGFFVLKDDKLDTNNENNNSNNSNNSQEVENESEKEVNIIDVNSKTRPYAVMINCHNAALPQAGLQDAYIVYELMVEGGITRMMALFKDKDVSKIGSIRSARTQYLDYVYENDAIYVHAGGAPDALKRINDEKISDIDVDGAYGFRDKNLNRSWEHTLFTSTTLLKNGVNNKSIKSTTDTKNILKYQADSLDLASYNNLLDAANVSIKYSDYRTSNYVYDKDKKVYLRSMNNTKNIDLVTKEQYEVKNIIVYGLNYSTYTYNSSTKYQKIDNVGTGSGYYITEGKAIPITWEKSSKNSQTKYTVEDTKEELVVNDGNTYIQIYPTSGKLTIS